MLTPQEVEKLEQLGLNSQRISLHVERIRNFLKTRSKHTFKINSACSIENHGVLELSSLTKKLPFKTRSTAYLKKYVSFVPAAGASTRYAQIIDELLQGIASKNFDSAATIFDQLLERGFLDCALPPRIRSAFERAVPATVEGWEQLSRYLLELKQTKALLPAVKNGTSFLEIKLKECERLGELGGICFVVPYKGSQIFSSFCEKIAKDKNILFLEQDLSLSTVRINMTGEIVRDHDNSEDFSIVPAGHGALVEVIPKVKSFFSDTQGIFIRNIDNVIGTQEKAVEASKCFLFCHSFLLDQLTAVRAHLKEDNVDQAKASAQTILIHFDSHQNLSLHKQSYEEILALWPSHTHELLRVLINVFHTPLKLLKDSRVENLLALYSRPLAFFGVVANTGKDIGGIPVLVEQPLGDTKVSLELPHISPDDQRFYFSDPKNAPFFNPSFVAIEHFDDPQKAYELSPDFWILAEKKFQGQPVYYHESVIYELIGNSVFANLVFIEIPRYLFNPCKSIEDTKSTSLLI